MRESPLAPGFDWEMVGSVKQPHLVSVILLGCSVVALSAATEPTVKLPDMKATSSLRLEDFKMPAKGEVIEPGFPNGSAQLSLSYPGKAFSAGVPTGSATVAVLIDDQGRAVDYLIVRYTQPFFGEALMEEAKLRTYSAKRLRTVAVPGVFHFTYEFEAPTGAGNISGFDAVNRRIEIVSGGPKLMYEPRKESEILGGQLETLHVEVPVFPANFPVPSGKTVRALVSFYVDEQGRVRLPNVESSIPPTLVASALAAVRQWKFKPPVMQGKPVLVRTMRAVTFRHAGTGGR